MDVPLEIVFKGTPTSDAAESLIRRRMEKLERLCDHIISARFAVSSPTAAGTPIETTLVVRIPPEHEVVVRRETASGDPREALNPLIKETFDVAERQVKKVVEKQRGDVKTHPEQQVQAFVVRIFKDRDYGFIKEPNGNEIYFHRNSVLHDDFDRLEEGTGVRYVATMGEEGPQASTVEIEDKPGVASPKTDAENIGRIAGW